MTCIACTDDHIFVIDEIDSVPSLCKYNFSDLSYIGNLGSAAVSSSFCTLYTEGSEYIWTQSGDERDGIVCRSSADDGHVIKQQAVEGCLIGVDESAFYTVQRINDVMVVSVRDKDTFSVVDTVNTITKNSVSQAVHIDTSYGPIGCQLNQFNGFVFEGKFSTSAFGNWPYIVAYFPKTRSYTLYVNKTGNDANLAGAYEDKFIVSEVSRAKIVYPGGQKQLSYVNIENDRMIDYCLFAPSIDGNLVFTQTSTTVMQIKGLKNVNIIK